MRNLARKCKHLFSGYKWWRKLVGGRWERWYVDHPVCSDVWHWVGNENIEPKDRPTAMCRGTPTVEYYT